MSGNRGGGHTSEALVPLICFLKCWMMFVSREEIQTMILSTEWLLCHVGELRYGPPKFFEENQKSWFLDFLRSTRLFLYKKPRKVVRAVMDNQNLRFSQNRRKWS